MNTSVLKSTLLTTALLFASSLTFAECIKPKTTEAYSSVGCLKEGLLRVIHKKGGWGFIDRKEKVVIPFKYWFADDFSEGLARVKPSSENRSKWGFINKTGKLVIPLKYDFAYNFSEGLAPVVIDGKWGFINKKGKLVIPLKYEEVLNTFSEGLVPVKLDNKWGFINKTGKMVIPSRYDSVGNFSEGSASAKLGGQWGTINKKGVFTPKKVTRNSYSSNVSSSSVSYISKPSADIYKTTFTYQVKCSDGSWGVLIITNGKTIAVNNPNHNISRTFVNYNQESTRALASKVCSR